MHTKSKHILSEPFAGLKPQEAFRAYLKASEQRNDELIEEMARQLSKDVKDEVNSLATLLQIKINLYSSYLFIRANLAITFYNIFLGNTFGVEAEDKVFDPDFANKWIEESSKVKKQIQEVDAKAKGALKLECFEAMEDMGIHFDFWLYLLKKIGTDFGVIPEESATDVVKSHD